MESLDRLEEILLESTRVPFSSNRLVNEQEVIDLLDSLRDNLPKDIFKAQKIITQGQEYIEQSKVNANNIINQANDDRNKLINTRGVREEAERQINELITNSTQKAKRTINEANRKASDVEVSIKTKIEQMEKHYQYKNERLESEYINLKQELDIDFIEKTKILKRKYEQESQKLSENIHRYKNELFILRKKASEESDNYKRDSIEFQQKTQQECDSIISTAHKESELIKNGANRYALDILNQLSAKIQITLQNIESGRNELNSRNSNRDYRAKERIISYKNSLKNALKVKTNKEENTKGMNSNNTLT